MSHFGMVGSLTTAPENREKLVTILSAAAELMQPLEGCHLYVVTRDADNDGKVWVMELWASQATHAESLTLPRVRELIAEAMPLLTSPPDGARLIPVSGKGL